MINTGTRAGALAALLLCLPGAVANAQVLHKTLELRGFGTLGAVYNNDENLTFVGNLSQPRGVSGGWSTRPDSLLGGQMQWRIDKQWEVMLQGIVHHHYDDYQPRLTWAFAKYSPDPNLTLRAGRVGFDAYMEADSRHVGYGYLPIRQPVEYFGFLQLTHLDGADLVYRRNLGDGILSFKAFAGVGNEKLVPKPGSEYDVTGIEVIGGYLHYRLGDLQLRAGFSHSELDKEYEAFQPLREQLQASGLSALQSLAQDLQVAGTDLDQFNMEISWSSGPLQAQLLYNRRHAETAALRDGYNVYGLVGYRFGSLKPYAAYARSDTRGAHRVTQLPPDDAINLALNVVQSEQYTWMLGARYDFTANAAVKFQLDFIQAPEPAGAIYAAEPDWDGDALVFSTSLDFVF